MHDLSAQLASDVPDQFHRDPLIHIKEYICNTPSLAQAPSLRAQFCMRKTWGKILRTGSQKSEFVSSVLKLKERVKRPELSAESRGRN